MDQRRLSSIPTVNGVVEAARIALRILLVEDNPEDVHRCLRELKKAGFEIEPETVDTRIAFIEKLLCRTYDLILSDFGLPGWSGKDAFDLLRKSGKDIPFILVTGTLGEESAVELIKDGITDYVLKHRLFRLPAAVRRALQDKGLRDQRKQELERLQESEESYRQLIECSPDAMLLHRDGKVIFANNAAATFFGTSSADHLVGRQQLDFVHPDYRHAFSQDPAVARRSEVQVLRLDGSEVYVEMAARSAFYKGEAAIQVTFRDVSQRKTTEEKLRNSEANLVAAQAIAHVGNWSWSFQDDAMSWSAEMFRIYGVSPGGFELNPTSVERLTHPADRWLYKTHIQEMLAGKSSGAFEYRIVRPDGVERVVQVLGGSIDHDRTGVPVRASGVVLDITERQKAEERFYKAFNASPEPITLASLSDGRYIDVNESFLRVTGYQRDEVIGRTSLDLRFWQRPEDREALIGALTQRGSVRDFEFTFRTKAGQPRTGLSSAEIVEVAGQECIISIFRDTTEKNALEQQLRQRQKMEAVGQLSGGIAHDFNNLLGVIIGYSDVLLETVAATDPIHRNCEQIKKAGESAASLTRQLLAFSRQQVLEPRVLALNTVVVEVERMLRRVIGEHIELRTVLSPSRPLKN